MMSTSIIVCEDRDAIAARALDLLISQLTGAVRSRGEAHLVLTGGSSASALFRLLRGQERSRRVDWHLVHVWQGDERFVPQTDAASNWATARKEWLEHHDGPRIPGGQCHEIPVDQAIAENLGIEWAAERYRADIERWVPQRDGMPAFDVVLLGAGSDGHIMSAFPGSPAIGEELQPALAVAAPTHIEPMLPRVTLAPYLLRGAGLITVMVPGEAKADIMAELLGSSRDAQRRPAQLALRPNAVWLLDQESAAKL